MKNRAIEAYRFLFCLVIALFHLKAQIGGIFFLSGYIIVEFFFILSGFLMAQSIDNHQLANPTSSDHAGRATMSFMRRKIASLYPHYLLSLLLYWSIYIFGLKAVTLKDALTKGWPEVLMLQMTGLNHQSFKGNGADWNVSALIIALFICSFLIFKCKKDVFYVLAPIIAVGIYVYMYRDIGHLGTVRGYRLNTLTGTLRGIAGVCTGSCTYFVFQYISKNYKATKVSKAVFTVVDIVCLAVIIIRVFSDVKTSKDLLMIPVFGLLILSVFLNASYISQLLDNNISVKLGSISYAVFLNHMIIRTCFKRLSLDPVPRVLLYLCVIIVISVITTKLISWISKTRLVEDPVGLIFERKGNAD